MNHKIINALTLLALTAATLMGLALGSCSKADEVDLRLTQATGPRHATEYIKALSIDGYQANIDNVAHTITVSVPEGYDVQNMKLTAISLPEGAVCDLASGATLNMRTPITLNIVYNGHHQPYTLQVIPDYVEVLAFVLNGRYRGYIDNEKGTIAVTVYSTEDIAALTVSMTVNEGATVSPQPTGVMDFTAPREFVVTKNTASKRYLVSVTTAEKGEIAFVGIAPNASELESPEERAAAEWMLKNVPLSEYVSFDAIASGAADLSQYKVVWWHRHVDNAGGSTPSPEAANLAIRDFMNYYRSGGCLLLTRYALAYLAAPDGDPDHANILGIGISKDGRWPNNCWGGSETSPDIVGGAWSFDIADGQEKHPIFQGLIAGDSPKAVYCFDKGYGVTNSTAQWHIGDWGGYASHEAWREKTGGIDLAQGGDGAVVIAEWQAADGCGSVIAIGSGCYDWYAHGMDTSSDKYHKNIETLTINAINYLKTK